MITILNVALHPELAELSLGQVSLVYTKHALDRCLDRKIKVRTLANISKGSIVEIERIHNKITKLVIRLSASELWDDVLVLIPETEGRFRVITAWRNLKSDQHATLNLERLRA